MNPNALQLANKGIPILMYHGFCDQKSFSGIENYHGKHLYVEKFEEQIRYLKQHYKIITLARLLDHYRNATALPVNSVLLTIDDGYASNFHLAFPILKKYQAPASIFITTDFVEKRNFLWVDRLEYALNRTQRTNVQLTVTGKEWTYDLSSPSLKKAADRGIKRELKRLASSLRDPIIDRIEESLEAKIIHDHPVPAMYEPLTPEQIKIMVDSNLVSVGSHTTSHVIMSVCSPEEMRDELVRSKHAIEQMSQRPCNIFSYPNGEAGDFNRQSRDILREIGFKCALTTVVGVNPWNQDSYELKRLNIHNDGDLTGFVRTLSSFARFLRKLKYENIRRNQSR